MKRISKKVKAIADAHIEAKIMGKFLEQHVTNKDELLQSIVDGYTYKQLLNLVEINYVTTTSLMMSSVIGHVTDAYRKQVYYGFKEILKDYNL
jgi:hypothetical protein